MEDSDLDMKVEGVNAIVDFRGITRLKCPEYTKNVFVTVEELEKILELARRRKIAFMAGEFMDQRDLDA